MQKPDNQVSLESENREISLISAAPPAKRMTRRDTSQSHNPRFRARL